MEKKKKRRITDGVWAEIGYSSFSVESADVQCSIRGMVPVDVDGSCSNGLHSMFSAG